MVRVTEFQLRNAPGRRRISFLQGKKIEAADRPVHGNLCVAMRVAPKTKKRAWKIKKSTKLY